MMEFFFDLKRQIITIIYVMINYQERKVNCMYKLLNEKEITRFVNKYFKIWDKDVKKVSVISYNGIDEYILI